jgi:DHA1 family bicyclomycin/chloramphenicol resistance-like MFS transporter
MVLGPMIIYSIGIGAASLVAITTAISTHARVISAASGLYGFMQMAKGALCALTVGYFPANPAISTATVLLAGILLGQGFFRLSRMMAYSHPGCDRADPCSAI